MVQEVQSAGFPWDITVTEGTQHDVFVELLDVQHHCRGNVFLLTGKAVSEYVYGILLEEKRISVVQVDS